MATMVQHGTDTPRVDLIGRGWSPPGLLTALSLRDPSEELHDLADERVQARKAFKLLVRVPDHQRTTIAWYSPTPTVDDEDVVGFKVAV